MMSKLVSLAVLGSLAVAYGAKLTNTSDMNKNIVPVEKEGRLIEIPVFGVLILAVLKFGWFLLSSVWTVVGYKLGALVLAANAAFWVFNNSFSVLFGAVAMFGFCKFTGTCSLDYLPHELIQVGETLVYAARNLEDGAAKYGDDTIVH